MRSGGLLRFTLRLKHLKFKHGRLPARQRGEELLRLVRPGRLAGDELEVVGAVLVERLELGAARLAEPDAESAGELDHALGRVARAGHGRSVPQAGLSSRGPTR